MLITASKGDKATQRAMLQALLATCGKGSLVNLAYHAGGKPTARAKREAAAAITAGQPAALLTGRTHRAFYTQKGELCLTLAVMNRQSETGPVAYRTVNVEVGDLTAVQVLEVRHDA